MSECWAKAIPATLRSTITLRWPSSWNVPWTTRTFTENLFFRFENAVPCLHPPKSGARSSAWCKGRSGLDVPGRDRVAQVVRVELVEQLAAGLGVGVHQERDRRAARWGQLHVVPHVMGEPVHLPAAGEALARGAYLGVVERQFSRRLLERHL